MPLSKEEVQHIATLCRIGTTDEDQATMADQLSHILELFGVLQEVDTEDILPTDPSLDVDMALRPDEPGSSLSRDDVLANAPRRQDDMFRVKVVLEE